MKLLSENEKKIFDILKKLKGDSLWMIAINCVCKNGDAKKFRQLISQLISQGKDQPQVMKNIIGSEAFEALATL